MGFFSGMGCLSGVAVVGLLGFRFYCTFHSGREAKDFYSRSIRFVLLARCVIVYIMSTLYIPKMKLQNLSD